MDAFKARLKVLADRIDALSMRERGAIFLAVMIVLAVIAHSVIFEPLRAEQRRLEQDFKTRQEQTRVADLQVSTLFSPDGKDINAENRTKVAALRQQIKDLDARMDQMTAGVVSPKEMARLMEQMLARRKGLELVRLEALAPMPIESEPKPAGPVEAAAMPPDVMVYRHGMRIELKGRYFEIVDYLKALEGLPWKVFWGEVSLETDKYPVSKVTLVIYTLSRHPGWIGV